VRVGREVRGLTSVGHFCRAVVSDRNLTVARKHFLERVTTMAHDGRHTTVVGAVVARTRLFHREGVRVELHGHLVFVRRDEHHTDEALRNVRRSHHVVAVDALEGTVAIVGGHTRMFLAGTRVEHPVNLREEVSVKRVADEAEVALFVMEFVDDSGAQVIDERRKHLLPFNGVHVVGTNRLRREGSRELTRILFDEVVDVGIDEGDGVEVNLLSHKVRHDFEKTSNALEVEHAEKVSDVLVRHRSFEVFAVADIDFLVTDVEANLNIGIVHPACHEGTDHHEVELTSHASTGETTSLGVNVAVEVVLNGDLSHVASRTVNAISVNFERNSDRTLESHHTRGNLDLDVLDEVVSSHGFTIDSESLGESHSLTINDNNVANSRNLEASLNDREVDINFVVAHNGLFFESENGIILRRRTLLVVRGVGIVTSHVHVLTSEEVHGEAVVGELELHVFSELHLGNSVTHVSEVFRSVVLDAVQRIHDPRMPVVDRELRLFNSFGRDGLGHAQTSPALTEHRGREEGHRSNSADSTTFVGESIETVVLSHLREGCLFIGAQLSSEKFSIAVMKIFVVQHFLEVLSTKDVEVGRLEFFSAFFKNASKRVIATLRLGTLNVRDRHCSYLN